MKTCKTTYFCYLNFPCIFRPLNFLLAVCKLLHTCALFSNEKCLDVALFFCYAVYLQNTLRILYKMGFRDVFNPN